MKTRSLSVSLAHPALQTLNVIFLLPQQSPNEMNSVTVGEIAPSSHSFSHMPFGRVLPQDGDHLPNV